MKLKWALLITIVIFLIISFAIYDNLGRKTYTWTDDCKDSEGGMMKGIKCTYTKSCTPSDIKFRFCDIPDANKGEKE